MKNIYKIDTNTRFFIKNPNTPNEIIITDLGGNHDLTRTYIKLAQKIWDKSQIGMSDLIEKEKNKGFKTWEFYLEQLSKEVC